jgi:antitoxin VapB
MIPGQKIGDVFRRGTDAYAEVGYPDEWQNHYQGGLVGYEPHEILATCSSNELITAGQVYSWNPSITGTQSEDTILVTEQGCQILTAIKDWPTIPIQIDGQTFLRPAIFERK